MCLIGSNGIGQHYVGQHFYIYILFGTFPIFIYIIQKIFRKLLVQSSLFLKKIQAKL